MEFLQIFLFSFVRINSTYSVKFRAKVFCAPADVWLTAGHYQIHSFEISVWRCSGDRGTYCSHLDPLIRLLACFFPLLFCCVSSERLIMALTDAHQAEVNAAAEEVMIPGRIPAAPAAVCLIQRRLRSRRVRGWEMTSGRGRKRPEELVLPWNFLSRFNIHLRTTHAADMAGLLHLWHTWLAPMGSCEGQDGGDADPEAFNWEATVLIKYQRECWWVASDCSIRNSLNNSTTVQRKQAK